MERLGHKWDTLSDGVKALRLKGSVDVFTYLFDHGGYGSIEV